MSQQRLQQVWAPEDAAALAELAARFPREVGESPVLADIVEREGLEMRDFAGNKVNVPAALQAIASIDWSLL